MSTRRLFTGLLALFRKPRFERELEEEIHAHLEAAAEDAARRGLSPDEARDDARRRFGAIEQIKEEHRDGRGIAWLETLLRDFRYALRSIRRAPGFTAVVIAVLALGIGGTVAMFSIVDAVLVKPLPFPEPDHIVQLWEAPRPGVVNSTTAPQFVAWKRLATTFDAFAAEQPISGALNDPSGPARVAGKLVTSEYFKVFGAKAALGRIFRPDEDQPGAAPVLVLSHSAWETYFGGDAGILQRRVLLDGRSYQVIGVLERGAFDRDQTKFWTPLIFTPDQLSSAVHWLTLYGRLRSGVSVHQARQQMNAVYSALLSNNVMDEERAGSIVVEPLAHLLVGNRLERSITIAFGAVLFVLLIACANVANLLFARGAARKTELAVRAALGAGRRRLAGQLFTECLALCLLGGLAGVAFAWLLIRLADPWLSESLPFTAEVTLSARVLVFAAGVVMSVAFLTAVFPAFETTFGDLADSLKQAARGSSAIHIRVRRAIIAGEVALSLVLACGALLLTRSLLKLQQLDTGVRIENVVTASIDLPTQAYPTPRKAALFYQALSERLRSVPGIAQVGLSTFLPLEWISNGEAILLPGAEKPVRVRFKRVDSGYFKTLEIPVLSGRGISDKDNEGSPRAVVINQALAARLRETAGMKDAVGKVVRLTSSDYLGQQPLQSDVQITGIIRSERTASPGYPDPPVVYVPLAQAPHPNIKLLVATRRDVSSVLPGIRKTLSEIDPKLPLGDIATMQQVRDETLSGASRPAWLIGAFAAIAVFLCAVGLYGVVSYSVAQQRGELGIRIALGARSKNVVAHVLRNALSMIAAGLAFGLLGVYAVTRVLASSLFEVSPLDPVSIAAACLFMIAVGFLAGFLPARRAARFDPAITLRSAG
jgi:putative ABC transport system permease protein